AIELKRGLERAAETAFEYLARPSRPIGTHAQREQLATVSAHHAKPTGAPAAEAVERGGADGAVSVAAAKCIKSRLDLVHALHVEGEALATLVLNRLRGALLCVAVKAPGFGDRRKELLRDIAAVTGGSVVSDELGKALEHVTLDDLGTADRVVVDRETTTIV